MALRKPFRYETLLRIRTRQEELQAQTLALVRRKLQQAKQERENIDAERLRRLQEVGTMTQHTFDAADVRRHYQYERHLAALIDEKDAEIQELVQEEERERRTLEEATKAKRMVEKLKERALLVQAKERRKMDERIIDEVATTYAAMGIRRER